MQHTALSFLLYLKENIEHTQATNSSKNEVDLSIKVSVA